VLTPDAMRDIAKTYADKHAGTVYSTSLAKLAADGIVDGIASDAARSWHGMIVRGRWHVGTVADTRRARHELSALVDYCNATRSRVYADALLGIREIAADSSVPSHSRIARIQLALDAIGLPTP
jgi:hypothetical protein